MLERNILGQIQGGSQSKTAKQKIKKARLKYWNHRRENPRCTKCGVKLTDKNWLPSDKKSGHWRCGSCERKRAKAKTRYLRDYRRKHIVRSSDNKYLKGNKRPWTPFCELCGNRPKKLGYHHWDDDDLSKGIWVYGPCHLKIEAIDNINLIEKWKKLKAKIEKESQQ